MIMEYSKEWFEQISEHKSHPLNRLALEMLRRVPEKDWRPGEHFLGVPELLLWALDNRKVDLEEQTWQTLNPESVLRGLSRMEPRELSSLLDDLEIPRQMLEEVQEPEDLAALLAQEIVLTQESNFPVR